MKEELARALQKQHYKVIGNHGAVKVCHWLREKLLSGRACYKELFYGIESHRCLQMTPTVDACNQLCLFCWRYQGHNIAEIDDPDDPEELLESAFIAQKQLVSGFKGVERCDLALWEESREPNQVAISLSGEPTLYPLLGGYIEACHKRGMTTFVVSNGTRPDLLAELDPLPTQLYISLDAPDKETYKKLCVPIEGVDWGSVVETMELLPSLDTRTVIRHTLVQGYNMDDVHGYGKLIDLAQPDFIEPKGYVFVGYSRTRMTIDAMPSHDSVMDFGRQLAEATSYEVAAEDKKSRVGLLSNGKTDMRIQR